MLEKINNTYTSSKQSIVQHVLSKKENNYNDVSFAIKRYSIDFETQNNASVNRATVRIGLTGKYSIISSDNKRLIDDNYIPDTSLEFLITDQNYVYRKIYPASGGKLNAY